MRLSTDDSRDEELGLQTIAAAAEAGVTVFDTAHAYGRGAAELGHNERLLARALRRCGAHGRARVVTKGGMARTGGAWIPDGRAKAILADCEASLAALDALPIDLYLLHAPDPRTPFRTSVRALGRLVHEDVVKHVGLANVNRRQLDEALELAPVAAVGRAQSVRRPLSPRGSRRALCRAGNLADRPLSAWRAAPRGTTRSPAGAGRGCGCTRRHRRRGCARVAARSLARRGCDSGRAAAGDCALRCPRCDRRPRRRRPSDTRARVRRASSCATRAIAGAG